MDVNSSTIAGKGSLSGRRGRGRHLGGGNRAVRGGRVQAADMADVIALDERVTGLAKPDYWHDVFARYGKRRLQERFFLVAERGNAKSRRSILGFIIGEVRAWEFGSTPC